jgi:hypothetical protein
MGLYNLLAKCLEFYNRLTLDDADGTRLRAEFNTYIASNKVKFGRDTHMVVKVVKVVFGNDRKRASAYGYALRSAVEGKVAPANFPSYVRNAGGLEKLRRQVCRNHATATIHKGIGHWQALADLSLARAKSPALTAKADKARINQPALLLATQRATGAFDIHGIVTAAHLVNAAYAFHAPSGAAGAERATAVIRAAKRSAATAAAIKNAR